MSRRLVDVDILLKEIEGLKGKDDIIKAIESQPVVPENEIYNMSAMDAAKTLLMNCSNADALKEMVDHLLVVFKHEQV